MEVEIGRGKKGRRAYGFDDIAIVPSRRTRDPDDIDISWKLGPYQFELPLLASAMDGVVSPQTAAIIGRLGGLAVLNLEGIFTRYENAEEQLERIASLSKEVATREMQDIYAEPVKPELIARRIAEIKDEKVVVAASLTPQRVLRYHEIAMEAGLDVLVIQGTVVSGEHVSEVSEPLNLKEFIPTLEVPVVVGGCASYHTGLHLMRTGAAGVLVGVGPGAACTTRGVLGIGVPQATAIADVAHARATHMLETGEYCQVIADGGMRNGGDVAKAIALGADAVMIGSPLARAYEAPGRGFTGAWRRSTPRCRAAPACTPARRRRSPRSSPVPRTRTTARSTSSVRCARRWRPPVTRPCASSRRPRSWSRPRCRPRARASSAARASAWATDAWRTCVIS